MSEDRNDRCRVVPELPAVLYVEVTNRCDSLCRTCIRTFRTLEPPKDLTLDELSGIADQFPQLERVFLHGIGEPLLNPHLLEMVAHLKTRGATVVFNTDAIGLTEKKCGGLLEGGLDELRVSLDAATAGTYRTMRGVPAFHRVVENVRLLAGMRRTREAARPTISLWFTTLRSNIRELPNFVRLAAEIGADEVNLQRLVFYGRGLAVAEESLHGHLAALEDGLLAEAVAIAGEVGIRLKASGNTTPEASLTADERRRPWSGCQRPWTLSYVTANGNVLPCCISPWTAKDYPGLILGNAVTQGFEAIWKGERYREFRNRFESDEAPDPCRGCGRLWSI